MNALTHPIITDEAAIMQLCRDEMSLLLPSGTEYAEWLEDIDTHVCARGDLVEAIRLAPSVAVRQLLHAIFAFREILAITLGKKFL